MSDDVHTLQEQVLKLQAFKDYVHQRLDERGIETHPEGKHSKHGCRIGDRLDLVFETIDEKTDQIFQGRELLKQAELDIAGAKSEYLRREREVKNWQLLHGLVKAENERKGKILYGIRQAVELEVKKAMNSYDKAETEQNKLFYEGRISALAAIGVEIKELFEQNSEPPTEP